MITEEHIGAISGAERSKLTGYELGVYDCINGFFVEYTCREAKRGFNDQWDREEMESDYE